MRQFPSGNLLDFDRGSLSLDLKPTMPDDAWAVLLTRVGIIIILITQPLFIISELRLGNGKEVDPWLLAGFHLLNFAAALRRARPELDPHVSRALAIGGLLAVRDAHPSAPP